MKIGLAAMTLQYHDLRGQENQPMDRALKVTTGAALERRAGAQCTINFRDSAIKGVFRIQILSICLKDYKLFDVVH